MKLERSVMLAGCMCFGGGILGDRHVGGLVMLERHDLGGCWALDMPESHVLRL
ncbi:hypothetical protein [Bartonella sp. AP1QHHD]|uniref:hypothetical protein n=1 Tax=Bartonella sp. AP1QHHD TaxID=3243474 RepID=UPI0035CEB48F